METSETLLWTRQQQLSGLKEGRNKDRRELLTPWQNIDAIKTFHSSRGALVHKTNFGKIDKLLNSMAKKWLNLPKRASNDVLPPGRSMPTSFPR
ncbi:TLDC2 [Cordylochernes scorpioides]|uniref:TLDC2 n=1 Tax=Cordylochernes scorpioides TaxID=51811 RepID=A0ABY6KUV5_9ARAC|nr:TLDC2 [Cordylochernes scorpioides]